MPEAAPLSEEKRSLLQRYLRGELTQTSRRSSAIARRPAGEIAPLSLSQQELWLRELDVPAIPPLYNECSRFGISAKSYEEWTHLSM